MGQDSCLADVLSKISACGRKLDAWNRDKHERMGRDIKANRLALKEANRLDNMLSWKQIVVLEEKLDSALDVEERYWGQRAKTDWLQHGDKNTRFFHSKACARKARNIVRGLQDDSGQWKEAKTEMVIIASYFDNHFTSSNPSQENMDSILDDIHQKISVQQSCFLDSKFSGEEIRKVVFHMNPLKAFGNDGLRALFFLKFWGTIGESVIFACLRVLNMGGSVQDFNNTVIALIPKIQNPVSMSDFRPISLCNVLYKIVSKVISNHFRCVLGDVISETQCAFVPGRLISDNTIVGFKCLHRLKRQKGKKGSMAFKLDMSKAYDRVEWEFLKGMMYRLGFSEKWVKLVMNCVSTITFSFKLNGEIMGNIIPTRGLRQGVPLSRYLFLICVEVLSSLISKAIWSKKISGFNCSRKGPNISHLFFVDDSLLFTKADNKNCQEV
ncbi:hypothetical protein Dsin_016537 [Dipteronia sinensis]|uniref:Reverse transcriptase domain-containing protein n=1 Tax=Dipteronia sinensis TaxID=43782 RepID=A0AAE0ADX5_9ROSI|nr:hypothetical protein Dsin_016537 [Dipteronia sinensis]